MKIIIIILFSLSMSSTFAQKKLTFTSSSDSTKLITDYLVGFWQESSGSRKIKFAITSGNVFYLFNPDSYDYHFFEIKSFPIDGISSTWPPNSCYVNKIDDNHIEITYIYFGREQIQKISYKKID